MMLAFAPGFDQTFDRQMYKNPPDKIWKVCKNGLCVIYTWMMSYFALTLFSPKFEQASGHAKYMLTTRYVDMITLLQMF